MLSRMQTISSDILKSCHLLIANSVFHMLWRYEWLKVNITYGPESIKCSYSVSEKWQGAVFTSIADDTELLFEAGLPHRP